eukprot:jgi/Mesen1/1901/ME000143S00951
MMTSLDQYTLRAHLSSRLFETHKLHAEGQWIHVIRKWHTRNVVLRCHPHKHHQVIASGLGSTSCTSLWGDRATNFHPVNSRPKEHTFSGSANQLTNTFLSELMSPTMVISSRRMQKKKGRESCGPAVIGVRLSKTAARETAAAAAAGRATEEGTTRLGEFQFEHRVALDVTAPLDENSAPEKLIVSLGPDGCGLFHDHPRAPGDQSLGAECARADAPGGDVRQHALLEHAAPEPNAGSCQVIDKRTVVGAPGGVLRRAGAATWQAVAARNILPAHIPPPKRQRRSVVRRQQTQQQLSKRNSRRLKIPSPGPQPTGGVSNSVSNGLPDVAAYRPHARVQKLTGNICTATERGVCAHMEGADEESSHTAGEEASRKTPSEVLRRPGSRGLQLSAVKRPARLRYNLWRDCTRRQQHWELRKGGGRGGWLKNQGDSAQAARPERGERERGRCERWLSAGNQQAFLEL